MAARQPQATSILSTDFTGRTVSGTRASNITWTTAAGIDAPGDLTTVDIDSAAPPPFELYDTPNAQGHFAPNLNVQNEGPWDVNIPLILSPGTASIEIEDVVIDWQHFNNGGAFQSPTIDRPVVWTADLVGSTSGNVATQSGTVPTGGFGIETLTFASPATLAAGQSWSLIIKANQPTSVGNNTGFDELTINGSVEFVPELSTLALAAFGLLGLIGIIRRRRTA